MPRVSSSAKRQHGAATQRDTRHENGLVGPGKRIAKQKSQTQLAVDGPPRPAADDAGLSSHPPPLPTAANGSAKEHDDMAVEHRTTEALRRASLGTYSESSSTESLASPPGIPEENHRRIDVNAAKNANVHRDPGPIDFALTVLRSCPLYDTMAILIILMQLSPAVLSTIYMAFTLLTFVPPVTTSSGLSLTDIFEGTLGTPSLTTLVCMDVVVLLIWLFLWGPIQHLILDLAQVVIALTLGGGASSRQGSANNIFLCVGMVLFSHFGRYPSLQKLSQLTSLFGVDHFFSSDPDDPLEPASRMSGKRGAYSWIRNLFAIHILTQGVVRYIREWYLRREKRDMLSQSLSDPEAGKQLFPGEASTDGGFSTPDTDVNLQSNAANVSTKKKRKQSAQVRIRQPLWAALASTKIVMVKEYELSHAASESAGAEATDVDNLGNAPFYSQPEQIWICYVGSDEVCFSTSSFPDFDEERQNGHTPGSTWVDSSKPFFVRVNNAIWQPTRIIAIQEEGEGGDDDERPAGTRWTGDIYGLTPSSNYECEFVSTRTGEVLFSTSVRTTRAPSRDAEVATKPTNSQRRRHESPATTIKASIATQDAKLNDEKAKLKAMRKENNRKVNALKKEIDKLSAAVQSAGGNDEKLRQKITQNTVQQKQAEQSLTELEGELKELDAIPEEVIAQHRGKQSAWTSEKAQFDGARASFKSFKNAIDREITVLEEEQSSLQAKRNKIATRIAKADNDHARIMDANARGLDEVERRRQESTVLEAQGKRAEQEYLNRLIELRAKNDEKQHSVNNLTMAMRTYLSSFESDVPYDEHAYSGGFPQAPWPNQTQHFLPGSMWPTSAAPSGPSLVSGAPPLPAHPMHHHAHHPHQPRTRGRSSSMLSDISGFTQSSAADDDIPATSTNTNGPASHAHAIPPIQTSTALRGPPGFAFNRARGSSGSGSGSALGSGSSVRSGSGSAGSVRDPTSPV